MMTKWQKLPLWHITKSWIRSCAKTIIGFLLWWSEKLWGFFGSVQSKVFVANGQEPHLHLINLAASAFVAYMLAGTRELLLSPKDVLLDIPTCIISPPSGKIQRQLWQYLALTVHTIWHFAILRLMSFRVIYKIKYILTLHRTVILFWWNLHFLSPFFSSIWVITLSQCEWRVISCFSC